MKNRLHRALAVLGVAALVVPAAAVAKGGPPAHSKGKQQAAAGKAKSKSKSKSKSRGKGHSKARTFVFKGTIVSDGSLDAVTVMVAKGNSAVRKAGFYGRTVSFDLSRAKMIVADTNGDSRLSADDVKAGDKVVVQAKLPRSTEPGADVLTARKLVDQTNPPVDEDEQETEATAPATTA